MRDVYSDICVTYYMQGFIQADPNVSKKINLLAKITSHRSAYERIYIFTMRIHRTNDAG